MGFASLLPRCPVVSSVPVLVFCVLHLSQPFVHSPGPSPPSPVFDLQQPRHRSCMNRPHVVGEIVMFVVSPPGLIQRSTGVSFINRFHGGTPRLQECSTAWNAVAAVAEPAFFRSIRGSSLSGRFSKTTSRFHTTASGPRLKTFAFIARPQTIALGSPDRAPANRPPLSLAMQSGSIRHTAFSKIDGMDSAAWTSDGAATEYRRGVSGGPGCSSRSMRTAAPRATSRTATDEELRIAARVRSGTGILHRAQERAELRTQRRRRGLMLPG